MTNHYDILVVGAGPAGLAAATVAAELGADTLLLDEQPVAGGQIYRNVTRQTLKDQNILGSDYYQGRKLVSRFAASGAEHLAGVSVWQVSPEHEVGISHDGASRLIFADQIILACGAQERPFPVPGWTLPGVITAGGAQVLLKSAALTSPDAVFIGTGPLLYLIAHQYLQSATPIRAILDTAPASNLLRALVHLPAALLDSGALRKGRRWISELRGAGVTIIKGIEELKLVGEESLQGVEYRRRGRWRHMDARQAFVHQGVVPNVNLAMAAGCAHHWSDAQLCWHAVTDAWFETDVPGIAVAGDSLAIGGARAAEYQGRIAGLGALHRGTHIDARQRDRRALPCRRAEAAALRARPFLDALFRPAQCFRTPADDTTIICRCEEVTAAQVREAIALGCVGPNRLKGFSRCGMGPCQGRFCGLTISEMIAQACNVPVADVGAMRLRPPVKPLSLGELAALEAGPESPPGNA